MKFRTYYYAMSMADRSEFAKKCGRSKGYFDLVASGHRQVSCEVAIAIERESDGLVHCEGLRPDVDWAYIRGTSPTHNQEAA